MQPSADPLTYRISDKSSESPTKVVFGGSDHLLLAGSRAGVLQLRDRRLATDAPPVHTASLSSHKDAIMDLEWDTARDTVLVTVGGSVYVVAAGDLRVVSEFPMPSPLTFRDEGGASMHPDGRKFIAVGGV